MQSGIDKLVDPFLSVDLDKVSPSKDKTTVVIHDMWHNLWFDDKKEDVMNIVEEWLEERNHWKIFIYFIVSSKLTFN